MNVTSTAALMMDNLPLCIRSMCTGSTQKYQLPLGRFTWTFCSPAFQASRGQLIISAEFILWMAIHPVRCSLYFTMNSALLYFSPRKSQSKTKACKWQTRAEATSNFDILLITYCTIRSIWQFPLWLIKYLLSLGDDVWSLCHLFY